MTQQAKPKIVVLISGNGSNLQSIIDSVKSGKIDAEIAAVISNKPEAYGLTRARNAGIEAIVVDHTDFNCRDTYDANLLAKIEQFDPTLVVLAGYMRILTADFVTQLSGKLLNIHPSLLPKYKGLNTHQRAIDAGDKEHGLSIHFVTPELDGGPVILQSKVPIFEDDESDTLAQRVQVQERQVYPIVVSWYCQKRLTMIAGKAYLDGNQLPPEGYAAD